MAGIDFPQAYPPGEEAGVPSLPGFVLPAKDHTLVHSLYGKICRICVDHGPTGSGFLVGPDLVLTASHVIQHCQRIDRIGASIEFRFLNGSLDAEITLCSVPIGGLNVVAQEYDPHGTTSLDYCFIRLPEKVGLMRFTDGSLARRGWFKLDEQQADFIVNKHIIMLHFPSQVGSIETTPAMSSGTILDRTPGKAIIYHDARTNFGSSGAVCLYQPNMAPAFLHLRHDGPQNRNVALSLARILNEVRIKHHLLTNELLGQSYADVFPRQTLMREPIINRDDFLEKIFGMVNGIDLVPLYAVGERQFGRSFLAQIIRTIAPHTPLFPIDLASIEFKDRKEFAARLVELLPPQYQFESAQPSTEREEAWFRWFTEHFLFQLSKCMSDGFNLACWVFVDSIDYDVDFIMDFVGHCFRRAQHVQNLRLCFAGSVRPNLEGPDYIVLNTFSEDDIRKLVREFGLTATPKLNRIQLDELLQAFFTDTGFASLSFLDQITATKSMLNFLATQP